MQLDPDLPARVTQHYDTGAMLDRIKAGLAQVGVDPNHPKVSDLKAVDEFHTGGFEATKALLDPLGITPDMTVLDVGCGIGGAARHIATHYGAQVTGVDLTPAFVDLANALSAMTGLSGKVDCLLGSALDMPVQSGGFDLATMFHVGMNIADKTALFADVFRCLRPGGRFALFDVMEASGAALEFPMPWATSLDESFVALPQAYRDAAREAGFHLIFERDRADYAKAFFAKARQAAAEKGPHPVGLQLIMGPAAKTRYANIALATQQGKIAPWEMVFQKDD